MKRYAEALQVFPKALAENSGTKATELISNLYAAHNGGEKTIGFNIEVSNYFYIDKCNCFYFCAGIVELKRAFTQITDLSNDFWAQLYYMVIKTFLMT